MIHSGHIGSQEKYIRIHILLIQVPSFEIDLFFSEILVVTYITFYRIQMNDFYRCYQLDAFNGNTMKKLENGLLCHKILIFFTKLFRCIADNEAFKNVWGKSMCHQSFFSSEGYINLNNLLSEYYCYVMEKITLST